MQNKKNIIFDLDGTIIDSQEGITRSVQYSLKQMGIVENDLQELTKFIGPPLYDSFERYYGFSGDTLKNAVTHYRTYFDETGLHQNELYTGIDTLIEQLASNGRKLAVATTKPEVYAVEILEDLNLSSYFAYIAGSLKSGERTDKTELIKYAMKESKMNDIKDTVMVGDTRFDMIGARELQMDSIGVFYGFGSEEEILSYHPTKTVTSVDELSRVLLP